MIIGEVLLQNNHFEHLVIFVVIVGLMKPKML